MKRLFFTLILLFPVLALSQPFQHNWDTQSSHMHDLNITPADDGTDDVIVAGNLFDPTMTTYVIMVKRLTQAGNLIWMHEFSDPGAPNARSFDVVALNGSVYLTGSVDVAGFKKVLLMEINANSGLLVTANFYDIVSPNFHARGLDISYTNSDGDGDGAPDPGFVIGGFFSDCYNVNTQCQFNNIGFVMRLDMAFNIIWTIELDAIVPGATTDYDFVNGVHETDDGFFITGSATGDNQNGNFQQAALAHKVDLMGNFVWDNSYIYGNANDVSVDAYYEPSTDKIYMLANYSINHYFAVTTFDDNTTGPIDAARTWYTSDFNDLNRYGFTIMTSQADPNNLVISGYDRQENWVDVGGAAVSGETNLFTYEFDKATGNPVGQLRQYLVPHVEPGPDEFNFWSATQLPLIYYPDISYSRLNDTNTAYYYHVGYRREPANGTVRSEVLATPVNRINQCERLAALPGRGQPSFIFTPVSSGFIPAAWSPINLLVAAPFYVPDECTQVLDNPSFKQDQPGIYPNPVRNQLNIAYTQAMEFVVYDLQGRSVISGSLAARGTIDVAGLPQGVYVLSLVAADGQKHLQKFIKE